MSWVIIALCPCEKLYCGLPWRGVIKWDAEWKHMTSSGQWWRRDRLPYLAEDFKILHEFTPSCSLLKLLISIDYRRNTASVCLSVSIGKWVIYLWTTHCQWIWWQWNSCQCIPRKFYVMHCIVVHSYYWVVFLWPSFILGSLFTYYL